MQVLQSLLHPLMKHAAGSEAMILNNWVFWREIIMWEITWNHRNNTYYKRQGKYRFLKVQSYQYSIRNTDPLSYTVTPMNLVTKSSNTVQGKHHHTTVTNSKCNDVRWQKFLHLLPNTTFMLMGIACNNIYKPCSSAPRSLQKFSWNDNLFLAIQLKENPVNMKYQKWSKIATNMLTAK